MERLGDAPALLSRRENANIDLDLDSSIKNDLNLDDVYEIEWTYSETKSLFFRILRSVSGSQQIRHCSSIQQFLRVAMKIGEQREDDLLCESIKMITGNIRTLENAGFLSREDDYSHLRHELVSVRNIQFLMAVMVGLTKWTGVKESRKHAVGCRLRQRATARSSQQHSTTSIVFRNSIRRLPAILGQYSKTQHRHCFGKRFIGSSQNEEKTKE